MDKNQAIGFVLMAALLMVWFYFFAPEPPPPSQEIANDSANIANPQSVTPDNGSIATFQDGENQSPALDSADLNNARYGVFTPAMVGKDQELSLENNVMQLYFSSKGGLVNKVELSEYEDYRYEKPLVLLDEQSSRIKYMISTGYGNIDLAQLYYTAEKKSLGDTLILQFNAALGNGKFISHIYSLAPNSYEVGHKFVISGLDSEIAGGKVSMIWDNHLKRLETDIKYSRNYTTVNYWLTSGSMEELSARSSEKQVETFSEAVSWIAFKQKFFTTGYVFNDPVSTGTVSAEYAEHDTTTIKYCQASIDIPLANFSTSAGSNKYYFGPIKMKNLKNVAPGFKENLYLGWPVVKWINQFAIIPIFNFLEKYISNYGIIIIILVFILKLVLTPLTYKSHISMAKTKALKPELDELKEKYGDDMQKMQSEQMKLYQQVGVNPLSGCIPMLLQMPILFAMFQFIPHAIEMRHKSFLWAEDLSTYDSIVSWSVNIPLISSFYGNHISLFTILMTLSTILYTWANSQSTAQMQGPMKSLQYFMPLIFMFMLNSFPAGLTFYYFVSNLVSFGQIAIIRKFVDDTKIRAILDENKLKNKDKKKSKFQARLENAMKASEENKKSRAKK
ncbi:MAG: membrane protein insertase YidC [Cyclobacteriaceae bacterium]|nr:membrane protein insertase YidC [Cyclobacteriaceae bacterium]